MRVGRPGRLILLKGYNGSQAYAKKYAIAVELLDQFLGARFSGRLHAGAASE